MTVYGIEKVDDVVAVTLTRFWTNSVTTALSWIENVKMRLSNLNTGVPALLARTLCI